MNPVALPNMDVHRSKMLRFIGSAFAEVKLLDGLKFKTQFSPDIVYNNEHRYWNPEHGNGPAYNGRLDKYHTTDVMYTSQIHLIIRRRSVTPIMSISWQVWNIGRALMSISMRVVQV